jgi:ABC-type polysaccharide/polyol phosphate transport system ATPase subunit
MNIDEVNTTIIKQVDREEAQNSNSIEIMPGSNFHWGYAPADLKKDSEKEGDRKKDNKKELKTEPLLIPDQESQFSKKSMEELFTLKDIAFNIKQGEFICIVGDVGAGKSSFLMSIIGDLLYASPEFAAKYRTNSECSFAVNFN